MWDKITSKINNLPRVQIRPIMLISNSQQLHNHVSPQSMSLPAMALHRLPPDSPTIPERTQHSAVTPSTSIYSNEGLSTPAYGGFPELRSGSLASGVRESVISCESDGHGPAEHLLYGNLQPQENIQNQQGHNYRIYTIYFVCGGKAFTTHLSFTSFLQIFPPRLFLRLFLHYRSISYTILYTHFLTPSSPFWLHSKSAMRHLY